MGIFCCTGSGASRSCKAKVRVVKVEGDAADMLVQTGQVRTADTRKNDKSDEADYCGRKRRGDTVLAARLVCASAAVFRGCFKDCLAS